VRPLAAEVTDDPVDLFRRGPAERLMTDTDASIARWCDLRDEPVPRTRPGSLLPPGSENPISAPAADGRIVGPG